MRSTLYVIITLCLFIFGANTDSFAQRSSENCEEYKAYAAYYQRCLTRQERLGRMSKAKEYRKTNAEKRQERLSKGLTKKQQLEQERIEAEEKAKLEATAKAAADALKETEEKDRVSTEDTDTETEETDEYTPIVVDPEELSDSQLQQIKSIIAGEDKVAPKATTQKATTLQYSATPKPPAPKNTLLPDVGLGSPEYIQLNPVDHSRFSKP